MEHVLEENFNRLMVKCVTCLGLLDPELSSTMYGKWPFPEVL